MDGNLIIAIEVVFISILIVYFFITLFLYLRPKKENNFGVEQETWQYGEKELTIIYKKDTRPSKEVIDRIKASLSQYEAMVMAFIDETGQYKEYKKNGIILEGFSFPVSGFENNDFDFSFDYVDSKNEDSFLVAYFKDGKLKSIKTSNEP